MFVTIIALEAILAFLILHTNVLDRNIYLKGNNKKNKSFCFLAGGIWVLVGGLQGLSAGSDVLQYYNTFHIFADLPIKDAISAYRRVTGTIKDPGYVIFVKVFSYIINNYRVFMFTIAIIFMLPFCRWIVANSEDAYISFLIYSGLFYTFFSITGYRQTIATALVVIAGDKYIKKRKPFPFIILALVAATFHKSALVFVPFYFLSRIRLTKITAWTSIGCFTFIFVLRRIVWEYIRVKSGYVEFADMSDGNKPCMFTFMYFFVMVMILLILHKGIHIGVEENRYYIAVCMAFMMIPFVWVNSSAMRIVQYYSIYLVLMVPDLIKRLLDKKSRNIASVVLTILFMLLVYQQHIKYYFMWQV